MRGLAAIAAKSLKETKYHLRYSAGWLVRLGDGTAESQRRAQRALDELWRFTTEMFVADAVDAEIAAAGIAPPLAAIAAGWRSASAPCSAKPGSCDRRMSRTPGTASVASTASTSATCLRRCNRCSARTRARNGECGGCAHRGP
jgi:phenylacetate-CoA oxygenase PaaI subunit